jgi:FMN phosphatase YigB (HAD superfamily)
MVAQGLRRRTFLRPPFKTALSQFSDLLVVDNFWRTHSTRACRVHTVVNTVEACTTLTIKLVLKAIIFDLGNVVIPFDFKRAYARLEPLCKHPTDEIRSRLRATGLVQRFETGQVEERRFVEEFSAALDFEISYDDFCNLWSCIFLPEPLIPEKMLQSLARRYPLLLLSNTNSIHIKMLRAKYPLLGHFRDAVLSHEVGAAKPSPKIYQEAVRRARCQPHECFFTDDIQLYVEAARELGIQAVQFQSAAQIEDELRSRGAL